MAWHGMAWHGMACYAVVWFGKSIVIVLIKVGTGTVTAILTTIQLIVVAAAAVVKRDNRDRNNDAMCIYVQYIEYTHTIYDICRYIIS